jgi:hypothetical protein
MQQLDYLTVYSVPKKIRLGLPEDGGYVIADISGPYDCYISCGVGREESFSKAFIAKYHMNEFNSFGIDSSIESYPSEYTPNISFIKKNVGPRTDDSTTDLGYLLRHYKDIFLKMDIEGGEFPWLYAVSPESLRKCKQIVIEVHGVNNDSWGSPLPVKIECLKKLATTHYLVHAHGNNARYTTHYIPNVFELTYVRKDEFSGIPDLNRVPLPIPFLDYPNNKNRPDHPLTMAPFTN